MPALSPTMTQGNLGKWKKQIGDQVEAGDVLVEIETDKAQMDFECQDEGYVAKIFIDSQKDVPVNTPIAVLAENKEDLDAFKSVTVEQLQGGQETPKQTAQPATESVAQPSAIQAEKSTQTVAQPQSASGDRLKASPFAKLTASQKNVPLQQVQGSGPGGRIVKADVDAYQPSKAAKARPAPQQPAAAFEDTPLSNVRRVIAERLTESKVTIPHYYLTNELRMDNLLKLRKALNEQSDGTYKLSVNDFIVKAAGLALKDVPQVNASWMDTFIRQYKTSDIAVAVATDNGLITPIVKSVEGSGLVSISQRIKELAAKAKDNKLQPHEYQGGSFTISNLGMYNISHFTAIINPPHAGILAIGSVSDKVVPGDEPGTFTIVKVANVTLSCDHRVVDGAVGAKWLAKFCAYLENPLKMML